jgi:hypothetical protein
LGIYHFTHPEIEYSEASALISTASNADESWETDVLTAFISIVFLVGSILAAAGPVRGLTS